MSLSREGGPGPNTRSPLDLAIAAAVEGDNESALRHVGPILEQDPTRSVAMMLAGRTLGMLGRYEPAALALQKAVWLGVREGSLPRALAAAVELARLGTDTSDLLDALARIFARGSQRLIAQGAPPPALIRHPLSSTPLPHTLSDDELIAQVVDLVTRPNELPEGDDAERLVPRQALLSSFDAKDLRRTLEIFDLVWVGAATRLIEQAESGQQAYILARGEVLVSRKNEAGEDVTLARLGAGSLFGEMALLSRSPRAASVVACRPSLLLVAKKSDLDAVVVDAPGVGAELADYCRRRMVDNLLRTSTILKCVAPVDRPALMRLFVTRTYEQGERIITQGQEAEGLHLVASGEVVVVRQDDAERTVLATLSVGEVVGEMALMLRRPAGANVIASVPTVTLHLHHSEFMGMVRRFPALLSHLYELAVDRDIVTSSATSQEATDADDFVLL